MAKLKFCLCHFPNAVRSIPPPCCVVSLSRPATGWPRPSGTTTGRTSCRCTSRGFQGERTTRARLGSCPQNPEHCDFCLGGGGVVEGVCLANTRNSRRGGIQRVFSAFCVYSEYVGFVVYLDRRGLLDVEWRPDEIRTC